jgi:hypothetical protein
MWFGFTTLCQVLVVTASCIMHHDWIASLQRRLQVNKIWILFPFLFTRSILHPWASSLMTISIANWHQSRQTLRISPATYATQQSSFKPRSLQSGWLCEDVTHNALETPAGETTLSFIQMLSFLPHREIPLNAANSNVIMKITLIASAVRFYSGLLLRSLSRIS